LILDNSDGDEVASLVADVGEAPSQRPAGAGRAQAVQLSALINRGLDHVDTPYLLLLNDDVTVVTPDWIEAMMEHAQRPEVGVVGAKLLYPDGTLQHAGVVLGIYDGTAHLFKLYPGDDPGYFGLPNVVRDYLAVTFACALMRTRR
jgi:GT2 family glycosyltransferase